MPRTITFAIIVGLLILESRKCSSLGNPNYTEWWENALVYEIWPASFQDSNDDGIGDLQGIINRLDYIDDLGVDIICLNPIYQSPFVDSGFDVSDYYEVNPVFGNLEDFDRLINETHARDIKLILDVVPNHTSDEHPWFEASKRMEEPYADYYIWAKGTVTENGTRLPPNNWISIWNNSNLSAWTYNDDRNQWYYHKFHEREPDLNLEHPGVRREIMALLQFWSGRDVDGFRITGTPYFFEDPTLRDEKSPLEEENTRGLPKSLKFLGDIRISMDVWSAYHDSQPKYLIAALPDAETNLLSYYGNSDWDPVISSNDYFIRSKAIAGSNASELQSAIEDWLNAIPLNATTNWMLSSRYSSRITLRVGSDRLDALFMLSMLLPGQVFTYFGDEIGMQDTPTSSKIAHEEAAGSQKPYNHMLSYKNLVRSPMQWDDSSPSAGFTTQWAPLITPPNPDYVRVNVAKQLEDPQSHLNVYQRLAELRKSPVFRHGDWELQTTNNNSVLVLRRTLTDHPVYLAILNLANTSQTINMTKLYPDTNKDLDVLVTSDTEHAQRTIVPRDSFSLSPNAGLVLKSNQSDESDSSEKFYGEEEEEDDAAAATKETETEAMDHVEKEVTEVPEADETEENREETEEEGDESEHGEESREEENEEKSIAEENEEEQREEEDGGEEEEEDEEKTEENKTEEQYEEKKVIATEGNADHRPTYPSTADQQPEDESTERTTAESADNELSSSNETPLASTNVLIGIIFVHALLVEIW